MHQQPQPAPPLLAPKKTLAIGLGLTRSQTPADLETAIKTALNGRPLSAIATLATLDSKAHHPALQQFALTHNIPLKTYTAAQINQLPQTWPSSAQAHAHVGTTGVCEPCALLAAPGGRIIVPKIICGGVTIAIAELPTGSPT